MRALVETVMRLEGDGIEYVVLFAQGTHWWYAVDGNDWILLPAPENPHEARA